MVMSTSAGGKELGPYWEEVQSPMDRGRDEKHPVSHANSYVERRGLFLHASRVVCIYGLFIPNSHHQELMPALFHNSIWLCADSGFSLAQGHTTREE